ncbi:hypothetical protein Slin15195_G018140 [Septoria linicola]|uniref:Uncharacterized protein n=1 Tax=Septoria linicola TaxID=215465 RepID=A0A9Q9EF25_9PEZI|nr:hypothetical protein Slin14017_G018200 [Septoria linicola]USW48495.1 hypothetical protein Slin15195_G018140 [Septoria linicola]
MLAAQRPLDVGGSVHSAKYSCNWVVSSSERYTSGSGSGVMSGDVGMSSQRHGSKLAVKNRVPAIVPQPPQPNRAYVEQTPSGASRLSQRTRPHSKSKLDSQQARSMAKLSSKKKSAGVLGFFTLKEPSNSALEEFAEQERRKLAAQKGSFLSGVSSQKIPEHVPKVNSKPVPPKQKTVEKDRAARNSLSAGGRPSEASERVGTASTDPATGRTLKQSPVVIDSLPEVSRFLDDPSSPPETPPGLERCDSPAGLCVPPTPKSCPRTPNLDSEHRPRTEPSIAPWTSNNACIILPSSGFSVEEVELGPSVALKHPTQPRSQHRTRPSGNDIAPWESLEPPKQTARPSAEEYTHAARKEPSRFGAKLGFK